MRLPATALYGSIAVLLNMALSLWVSWVRHKVRVPLGHGEVPELQRSIRAHGNNAEYTAMAIVMLLVAELLGGASAVLHGLGGAFVVGRALHAAGILGKFPRARLLGTTVSHAAVIALAFDVLALRVAH